MKPLRIWLGRIHNVLLFKVLEQDDSIRKKGKLFEYDRLTLLSSKIPSMCKGSMGGLLVYVRGEKRDMDNLIASYDFNSEAEAITHMSLVENLISEYNKSISDDSPREVPFIFSLDNAKTVE
jgi:hypothetical protein